MAQTTDPISAVNAKIEVGTNGTVWTDISGSANAVEPGEQTRQSGYRMTHTGDIAIIASGKREPLEITVNIIYTEQAGEAFETVRAIFESSPATIYLRYSPKGGASTNFQYTSDAGVVTAFGYPPTNAEDAAPKVVSFTLMTPKLTKSAVV